MTDVIKFTTDKFPEFKTDTLRLSLLAGMREYGQDTIKEFDKVVSKWNTSDKPEFTYNLSGTGKNDEILNVWISTEDRVFHYVDKGVPAHNINPSKYRKTGTSGLYSAGSAPGTLDTTKASKHSGFYLNLNWIIPWPGIKAREFSRQIKEKVEDKEALAERIHRVLVKESSKGWYTKR